MMKVPAPRKPAMQGTSAGRGGSARDAGRRFRAALARASSRVPSAKPLTQSNHEWCVNQGEDRNQPQQNKSQQREPTPPCLTELSELWQELVSMLQEGQRLTSEQWMLRVRLDDATYPTTILELACAFGTLSVTLRTASQSVYARILSRLPALNERLKLYASASGAVVELVPLEDIES